MDTFFIICAKYLIVLPVAIAAWFFYRFPEKRKLAIFGIASLALTYIAAKIGSHLYNDPRPFVVGNFTPLISHAPDNGFPSDHMLLASALPAVIIYYSRPYAIVLWALAIIIGISRIYVGVHHRIDVVGSVVIAVVMTGIVHFILRRYKITGSVV
jgi:undecaprenyl-diphosphatase